MLAGSAIWPKVGATSKSNLLAAGSILSVRWCHDWGRMRHEDMYWRPATIWTIGYEAFDITLQRASERAISVLYVSTWLVCDWNSTLGFLLHPLSFQSYPFPFPLSPFPRFAPSCKDLQRISTPLIGNAFILLTRPFDETCSSPSRALFKSHFPLFPPPRLHRSVRSRVLDSD